MTLFNPLFTDNFPLFTRSICEWIIQMDFLNQFNWFIE